MSNILEKVVLTDVLKQPTKMRSEATEEETAKTSSSTANLDNDDFDFSEQPEEIEEQTEQQNASLKKVAHEDEEEDDHEEIDFDPAESADAAIDIMDVLQQTILMPLSSVKLSKRYGGKDKIKELKAVYLKKKSGDKLTDDEKKMASQYEAFKSSLDDIRSDIPFSTVDVAALKPSTTRMLEKHGFKVNEGLAFGTGFVKVMMGRVIDLVML